MDYGADNGLKTEIENISLTILDNTDQNLKEVSSGTIISPLPDQTSPNYQDVSVHISIPYSSFAALFIDGVLYSQNEDYCVSEGSTIITILVDTFRKIGVGTHTICAEFRENGNPNGELLHRVSQNFTINSSSEYIYSDDAPGEDTNLPVDILNSVLDAPTAVNAVNQLTSGMTNEQKSFPTGVDLATLYAETAVSMVARQTVDGGAITVSAAAQTAGAVERALSSGGVATARYLTKTVVFTP